MTAIVETLRSEAAATTRVSGAPDPFDPATLGDLPEPARRWLSHAITAGTPLATSAEFCTYGRIRLGTRWHDYTATLLLAPDSGFVWSARGRVAGLPVGGDDSLVDGRGRTRRRLLGVPVGLHADSDATVSAADRLAAQCVLLPTTLVAATWHATPDPDCAVYLRRAGRFSRTRVAVRVAASGRLTEISLRRWDAPNGRHYGQYDVRVRFTGQRTVAGLTIADTCTAARLSASGVWQDFLSTTVDSVAVS